jgi:hypothetical protein
MSSLVDFDAELERIDTKLANVGGGDEKAVYIDPHCGTCHFELEGVAAKSHKKECQGNDGHKVADCPHPRDNWRKSHHKEEVQLLKKKSRLLKAKAKAEAKVIPAS